MPANPAFSNGEDFLSISELIRVASCLHRLAGIDTVRITGGEPLMRRGIPDLVGGLKLAGISKVGLTTNGMLLATALQPLLEAGLDGLNVSLDSLRESGFKRMSRRARLNVILENLETARELGFKIKLNCVVMRSINLSEIQDLLEYSWARGFHLRFLEVMRIGVMTRGFDEEYVGALEILEKVAAGMPVSEMAAEIDSTERVYWTPSGEFGIIASESMPFCAGCSRIRLTADGKLMGCLFKEDHRDLKPIMKHPDFERLLVTELHRALSNKPLERIPSSENTMYAVGG